MAQRAGNTFRVNSRGAADNAAEKPCDVEECMDGGIISASVSCDDVLVTICIST